MKNIEKPGSESLFLNKYHGFSARIILKNSQRREMKKEYKMQGLLKSPMYIVDKQYEK